MNRNIKYIKSGEDLYIQYCDGSETGIMIARIPPYSIGSYSNLNTVYNVRCGNRDIGERSSLVEAKRLARSL